MVNGGGLKIILLQVSYSIGEGNDLQQFAINQTTGEVTTTGVRFDFEETSTHTIEIIASDGGDPSLSTSTNFVVHITDVNDNVPQFSQASFSFE